MRHLQTNDLTIIDDETPRVRDVRLGEALGFDRPRKIRDLIIANLAELNSYGSTPRRGAMIEAGKGAKREVFEYWLSEEQALLITMFSRTERAAEARREIIRVFMAYRRGAEAQPVKVADHRRAKPSRFSEARARRMLKVPTLTEYEWSNIALFALGEVALFDPDRAEAIGSALASLTHDRDFALTAAAYRAGLLTMPAYKALV